MRTSQQGSSGLVHWQGLQSHGWQRPPPSCLRSSPWAEQAVQGHSLQRKEKFTSWVVIRDASHP
jgi:hypothetical protein